MSIKATRAISKSPAKQMQVQTGVIRDKTEVLLDRLIRTRQAAERQSRLVPSADGDRAAQARQSLEQAITSTRKMIARLNNVLDEDVARETD